jgi:hypothetical protein
MVAYINIGCYYFIGVPLGVLLGFKFDFGIKVRLIHGPPAPHMLYYLNSGPSEIAESPPSFS